MKKIINIKSPGIWGPILTILITTMMLTGSMYFQYVKEFQPCPLCLMQRNCLIILLIINIIYIKRNLCVFNCIIAILGIFFASRQLWLQFFSTSNTATCLPNINLIMKYFNWQDITHIFFWGSSDCAEISWRFLGLTMPAWVILYFITIIIINIRSRKK